MTRLTEEFVKTRMARTLAGLLATVGALAALPAIAQAAAPDGNGPWADEVQSSTQGKRADGTAVLPARSNPTAALGVAEDTNSEGTFFSLGFGGQIVLGFKNAIVNDAGADMDLELVESTFEPYPKELVDVYVGTKNKYNQSTTWTKVASGVNKDAQLSLPASIKKTRTIKIVDVSDKSLFTGSNLNADGYDVDGVKSLHTVTGGGGGGCHHHGHR